MSKSAKGLWTLAGVGAGFVLSFMALGVLWIGTPWPYQFLMFAPFLLIAYVFRRFGSTVYPLCLGAAPLAMLFVQFRDARKSHLLPILLVASWALAIWLGHFLGGRWPARASR